jgi:hypothetical protein
MHFSCLNFVSLAAAERFVVHEQRTCGIAETRLFDVFWSFLRVSDATLRRRTLFAGWRAATVVVAKVVIVRRASKAVGRAFLTCIFASSAIQSVERGYNLV